MVTHVIVQTFALSLFGQSSEDYYGCIIGCARESHSQNKVLDGVHLGWCEFLDEYRFATRARCWLHRSRRNSDCFAESHTRPALGSLIVVGSGTFVSPHITGIVVKIFTSSHALALALSVEALFVTARVFGRVRHSVDAASR